MGAEADGATPLTDDELDGLIPPFVATRGDLNVAEFDNIARALPWALEQARRGGVDAVLDHAFLFRLHRRMFGDVWRWAGTQRRRVTNIGVEPSQISMQTAQVIDDAKWWHTNEVYDIDERAARLHARLVAVHPFPNGNGRSTRLLADLYLAATGTPIFTWGSGVELRDPEQTRRRYLDALRAADRGDFASLVSFARS
jgi:Fic-DOC domain mobile mystery protein B